MTFNFYDMQVVAVKYGQILATQHGEEHEKQNPKYTATWFLLHLDVRRRNRRREDRRAESLGIVSSREHSYACILADLQPYSRNLIGKN